MPDRGVLVLPRRFCIGEREGPQTLRLLSESRYLASLALVGLASELVSTGPIERPLASSVVS